MDVIEYLEKIYGIELFECQEQLVKQLADLPEGSQIVMGKNRPVVIKGDHEQDA